MATSDIVEIVVEIVNNTKDDIAEIRAELESIGAKDLNVDLDVNSTSEIAETEAKLQALSRTRTVDIATRSLPSGTAANAPGVPAGSGSSDIIPYHGSSARRLRQRLGSAVGGAAGGGVGVMRSLDDTVQNMENPLRNAKRQFSQISSVLDRITPNIMQVWNALAALIPILISVGAAAIGLAGALVTLGAAAAGIIGIGLLGWGDDFGSSLDNATDRAKELGSTLFDIMQPVADTFQPIMEGWMEGAPRQAQKLVEPMQKLAVFSDTLSDAGSGFISWMADAINSMTAMEQQISQISMRFGEIAGGFMIDFMENMTQFAYENQEALIQVSAALRRLLSAVLQISVALVSALSAFSPLTIILEQLAKLLNTRVGRGLITAVGLLLTFKAALGLVNGAVWVLQGGIIKMALAAIPTYNVAVGEAIASTQAWIASLSTLKTALLTTGVGAALVAGGLAVNHFIGRDADGPAPSNRRGGSSGGGTYINIEGDVREREMDRLLDQSQTRAGDEITMSGGN